MKRTLISLLLGLSIGAMPYPADCDTASQAPAPRASIDVDGVQVSGNVHAVSAPDLKDAIKAVRGDVSRLTGLEVVNKDFIHAFLKPHDLGWMAVTRGKYGWGVS